MTANPRGVRLIVSADATREELAERLPQLVDRELGRIVRRTGAALQTAVRKNASTGYHRPGLRHLEGTGPGPNVATGDYRRSITLTTGKAGGTHFARVSTSSPQAWRLERGFVGRDSLGRYYRQGAYPHWQPAVDTVEPQYAEDVEALLDEVVRVAGDDIRTTGGLRGRVGGL